MNVFGRKNKQSDFFESLPQAIARLKKNIIEPFFGENGSAKFGDASLPLRSEIFTRERLQQHAISLAKRHVLVQKQAPEQLLKRLSENEHILLEVHELLSKKLKEDSRIAPAGEWLLDNFYLIEEHIYTGKKHLPKGYSKTLPQLLKGESAGLPRVYDLAVEIISHSDGHVDIHSLTDFINAYQTISFLKLGELWAIPIMLRLALLENLRRLSLQIAEEINNKSLATKWADEMIDIAEKDPKNLVLVIADMARSDPPMESTFVAEFTRRLQEKGSILSLPLNWMEQRLAEIGLPSHELIQQDNQAQAAMQVSISNSISGLRFLNSSNWRDFVEETSIVESTLREDMDAVYQKMDFNTRDQYRHAVEKLAKDSAKNENEIAAFVINKARESHAVNPGTRTSHVGYYLTGKGYLRTAKEVGSKISAYEKTGELVKKNPLFVYLGSIVLITFLTSWLLIIEASKEPLAKNVFITICVLSLLATTHIAVSIVNWLSTILTNPSLLPRMDYSKGIPDESRSMVVIPTLITSIKSIDKLVEGLEVRFLANKDINLHFALLTDFKDSLTEHTIDDEVLIRTIRDRVIELNQKYYQQGNNSFFLFHRPRKWNPHDKIWMGYERKRGKLTELNELLRGGAAGCFSEIVADRRLFEKIKYIITLDTDTQLPRDTAWKMIGCMAHPLNTPVYDTKKKRVTEGYSILQPRVSNSLPADDSSVYARLHGNDPGTDPYTKATSDVYQDLFQEGSFIGKGIYDIDAFELALKDKLPENRILSHDLLEGCFSRSGLITDIQLYEEYPLRYETDMQRRHRWIRGDWQISKWILPWVSDKNKKLRRNPLSLFSRWKIFDNLRRSLVPLALVLLFLFGWTISNAAWFWTMMISLIIVLPSFVSFAWEVSRKPPEVDFLQQLIYTGRTAFNNFIQQILELTFLPYEMYINLNAILRTLWRMYISKKNLLEWNPFNSTQQEEVTIGSSYRRMWFEPLLAIAVYAYLTIFDPTAVLFALPFLSFWMAAPLLAYATSRPVVVARIAINDKEKIYLRMLARKTWSFFEKFVKEEDNWLPPDNYQEAPVERVAHRTSPTNIGLSLLSNLTAYDFGYITVLQLVERTSNTIDTMLRMERYRGHLYNWYDTISLVPLFPKYISTVDSGNMAGHLITLKQGLISIPENKIIEKRFFEGLCDTINILIGYSNAKESLIAFRNNIENDYPLRIDSISAIYEYLVALEASFTKIFEQQETVPDEDDNSWALKFLQQINEQKKSIHSLAPWLLFTDTPQKFNDLIVELPHVPTLKQIALIEQLLLQKIISHYSDENSAAENDWLKKFRESISQAGRRAKEIILTIEQLAEKCIDLANIDYDFLYDRSQHLLAIGYNVEEHRRDASYYDLLASEARLTTFVAIAQGKLPQESWFALGRQLTNLRTTPILLSWSGSMFEYLMPLLVMPTYENTLLEQTYKAVIQKQIEYGKKRNIPWGISESGYNMVDASLNYQYKAFGVPGLGFKRGLGEDLVISPYSTVMSLMVSPNEAYDNLQVLKQEGFEGRYGFYEAIDYTNSRLQRKQKRAIIQSYMVHHQGMSFLSLSYLLLNKPMQQRFESEVHLKSTLLLLQERIPRVTTFYSPSVHAGDTSFVTGTDSSISVINTPNTSIPEIQLLSNGKYDVMLSNAGGGYSRWKGMSVTRWREDTTCDNWGSFCYIRDIDSNMFWSSAYQPSLQEGENYEAVFSQGRAEFRRRDFSLETHTEIVVSPEDDVELRRVHITNRSRKKRTIEITSYAEVVLTTAAADEAHPAFSNLFVQTEIREQRHAILCTRRPRSENEKNPWMFHLMKVHDAEIIQISYETDREQFIGRGNSVHNPQVMKQLGPLKGGSGSVLDPIVSVRYRIILEGNESVTVDILTGMADTKEICNQLVDKYQERHLFNRVLELAWTHSQVILHQINATEKDAQLYTKLAGSIIFSNKLLRADPAIIIKNRRGQSGLWSYSISGDLPIVLLQIEDAANIELVKQMIQAHAYWRLKGLIVDLVIWNDDHGGYRQILHNQIQGLITPGMGGELNDQPGGIFIRSTEQVSNEDSVLFQTVAQVVISDKYGTLEEQLNRRTKIKTTIPYFIPTKFYPSVYTEVEERKDLLFFNGLGGFTDDGKEYVITTTSSVSTPAPWVNVLANPGFGTVISESGQSYTWVENAHEIRLTPWNNDPVTDLKGEAFYLKDEESGRFWSPTALPCAGDSPYITRHGFGYSVFEHSEDGIYSAMTVYADIEMPVKYMVIRLRNHSGRQRRFSITGYIEWVLGDLRAKYLKHTVTELDERSGAILASNFYSSEFQNRVVFFDAVGTNKAITTDRTEFLGRNGSISNPDGLNRARLSGKTGAALDPCAVIQIAFDLAEDEEKEIIFRLGAGTSMQHALDILQASEGYENATTALEKVHQHWNKTLNTIQLKTPDTALNILANGWLNYQTLASRIWARSGFYQSGGAFGFRDQLQDTLSLMHNHPELVRAQILLCASRQFKEGDVQHWWHPPTGRGVRTTCSDDFLWLPFVTAAYLKSTADKEILEEKVHFLEGRLLNAGEDSYYDLPGISNTTATLYEHCVKAIEHGLRFGEHGLPFMGSGDWNDGMDKVGEHGKGESVWLAFFLYDILIKFAEVALAKDDITFSTKCKEEAAKLRTNIDEHAWDGEWYRRAYFDDGTPLGSKENVECKIDSIAQSWSVLSKAGDEDKKGIAMASAEKYLVRKDDGLIQLFNPPFDKSNLNPGYIKGYVPGVRENGGQYTHAAVWLVMAFAAIGENEKTWELLQMINPLNRGNNAEKIAIYKSEPYVIAADVYAEPMHKGQGGWTWYTGSAGWMYQLIIGSFIGLKKEADTLTFNPCIPKDWPSLELNYIFAETNYNIKLIQSDSTDKSIKLTVDGIVQHDAVIHLVNDNTTHQVTIEI